MRVSRVSAEGVWNGSLSAVLRQERGRQLVSGVRNQGVDVSPYRFGVLCCIGLACLITLVQWNLSSFGVLFLLFAIVFPGQRAHARYRARDGRRSMEADSSAGVPKQPLLWSRREMRPPKRRMRPLRPLGRAPPVPGQRLLKPPKACNRVGVHGERESLATRINGNCPVRRCLVADKQSDGAVGIYSRCCVYVGESLRLDLPRRCLRLDRDFMPTRNECSRSLSENPISNAVTDGPRTVFIRSVSHNCDQAGAIATL